MSLGIEGGSLLLVLLMFRKDTVGSCSTLRASLTEQREQGKSNLFEMQTLFEYVLSQKHLSHLNLGYLSQLYFIFQYTFCKEEKKRRNNLTTSILEKD